MTKKRAKRKLRGILSADAVGYSRLMQNDELSTIRKIEHNKKLMSELVQQYRGRVVDDPGDNLLAEFGSVVDATDCAVHIQRELKAKNAKLPSDQKLDFRIGINLGDVVIEADRIYGDGVNIAARIEGLAKPGEIYISRSVFDHVKNKLELGYEYLGKRSLKNIADPVEVYRVLIEPEFIDKFVRIRRVLGSFSRRSAFSAIIVLLIAACGLISWYIYENRFKILGLSSLTKMSHPLPDKPSIAVLAFDNLTGDPDKDYFSDGISDEIITALSKIPKLLVIARNSTFTYKGKPIKVQRISEDLDVQYVVEGSVRQADERVRISAQLIDALNGHHIWAERYDHNFRDIFTVQEEITKSIITALQIRLTEGEQAALYAKGTNSLDAYLKAMEANWRYYQGSKEGILSARKLTEESIALDPNYAVPYRILGNTHGLSILLGMNKSPAESLKLAINLSRKAVNLDESMAMAHISLGFWLVVARHYEKGRNEGKRGFELEPNSSDVVMGYAAILTTLGENQEAIPLFKRAIRLNPIPPSAYMRVFAIALRDSGQFDEAILQANKATEQSPNDLIAWVVLTSSYSQAGHISEAREAAKEILRIDPKFSVARWQKKSILKDRVAVKRSSDALRKAGLPE